MRARAHRIDGRRRPEPLSIADGSDFVLTDDGEADGGALAQAPNVSLYCLDDASRRALFVQTPERLDLSASPFVYQAQFEHAERLFSLSYDDFFRLAEGVGGPDRLGVIYSVGRCGSTLLGRIFDRDRAVACLSEPDAPSQITGLREASGRRDEELTRLLRAALRLQVHAAGLSRPSAAWVLKPRSFCVETADLMHAAFPDARLVFLYRNAEDWARSAAVAFKILEEPAAHAARSRYPLFRLVPLLRTFSPKVAGLDPAIRFLALLWLSPMQRALELGRAGLPLLPVRYEDLVARRLAITEALFAHCGVPLTEAGPACQAFERDAQEGTVLSRTSLGGRKAGRLEEPHLEQLRAVLRQHPEITSPGFVLPGTLSPGRDRLSQQAPSPRSSP